MVKRFIVMQLIQIPFLAVVFGLVIWGMSAATFLSEEPEAGWVVALISGALFALWMLVLRLPIRIREQRESERWEREREAHKALDPIERGWAGGRAKGAAMLLVCRDMYEVMTHYAEPGEDWDLGYYTIECQTESDAVKKVKYYCAQSKRTDVSNPDECIAVAYLDEQFDHFMNNDYSPYRTDQDPFIDPKEWLEEAEARLSATQDNQED